MPTRDHGHLPTLNHGHTPTSGPTPFQPTTTGPSIPQPPAAHPSRRPFYFLKAVIAEKFIFLSGTPGFDLNTGRVINDSFEDQARQCFQNIRTILQEAVQQYFFFCVPIWSTGLSIINQLQ